LKNGVERRVMERGGGRAKNQGRKRRKEVL
jgi:hypothetical protein